MKLTIQVTADDIAQGFACIAESCPIARALRRRTGLFCRAFLSYVLIEDSNEEVRMPPEGTLFIMNFDRNRDRVKPIELTFEVPGGLYDHITITQLPFAQ